MPKAAKIESDPAFAKKGKKATRGKITKVTRAKVVRQGARKGGRNG